MALPLYQDTINSTNNKEKTTKDKVENTYTDELIIGICSPIGSDITSVINEIKSRLNEYNYKVEIIKLSDFINKYYDKDSEIVSGKTEEYSKLMHKIRGGSYLRKHYDDNSILAELAIRHIRLNREKGDATDVKSERKCYIIDSLKNLEELKLLRSIYREIFYLFSVFSPEQERSFCLNEKNLAPKEIEDLMNIDEYENKNYGQDVRNTFVNADFFIRVSQANKKNMKKDINRYIHLIFDSKIVTPNYHETAMYHAKASAGNSACLSRQVGATITDSYGIVIARGWNDVPKFGGNLYQDTCEESFRCEELGFCSNVTHRNKIFLKIEEEIEQELNSSPSKDITGKIEISNNTKKIMNIIRTSDFKNIIEYSRSIHAEMHAIIIGSQMTNNKMVGGNLYCTTYPCHNCARHIILAGIKNIFYIEPYKKSLGMILHEDALTEEENNSELNKVKILPYSGVSPRRYLEFFSMKDDNRKDENGDVVKNDIKKIVPKYRITLQALPTLEEQAIFALSKHDIFNEGD